MPVGQWNRTLRYLSTAAVLALSSLAGCAAAANDEDATPPSNVRATADAVLSALATHDMAKVASVVDGRRGVRFSPYPYVDTVAHRRVLAAEVANLWQERDSVRWGDYDGTGAPIHLTYPGYHAKFVYDVDFLHAPRVAVDSAPMGRGNTTNNIADVYPGASIVEYYLPGRDPEMGGMDWRSLWLVFERDGPRWLLVGIVHGAWTI
jgi:hypothetical protein